MENSTGDNATEIKPTPGRCTFFVKRKRRYCKLIPAAGKRFCGEHLPRAFYVDGCNESGVQNQDGKPARERIPCPLDPKHTVYADQLKKHLKKCNARESELPAYHVKSINKIGASEELQTQKPLSSLPREELLHLIDTVNNVYKAHRIEIPTTILSHSVLQAELSNPMNGTSAKKHLCQVASLLGQLQNFDLLGSDTCYVEFGAGRGQMSHWVQKALIDQPGISFLLVDRAHVRHKFDTIHRLTKDGPKYERIRIDIEHLCLGKVPSVCGAASTPLVTYSKHLCGAATDLTLHCLMETLHTDNDATKDSSTTHPSHSQVRGIVIALCCHHRCDWSSYVGREWWLAQGLTAQDFMSISHMSSWATCGSRGQMSKVRTAKEVSAKEGKTGAISKENEKEATEEESIHVHVASERTTKEVISEKSTKSKINDKQSVKEASAIISIVCTPNSEEMQQVKQSIRNDTDRILHTDVVASQSQDNADEMTRSKVSKIERDGDVHSQGGDISAQRLVGLDVVEREDIGRQCKRLIDIGRMAYLEGLGFKPRLVYYVDRELSLENIALVAIPNSQP